MTGSETKTCTRCGEVKPVGEFYPRYGYCKVCTKARTKAWREENRERANELAREAYARLTDEQKGTRRDQHRTWRNGPGREIRREIKKRYSERHKEQVAGYWADYSERTREERAERRRANYDPDKKRASRNPEKMRKNGRDRRARELDAFVQSVEEDFIIIRDEGRCGICGEPVMGVLHFDHIIPLAAGGTHEPNNVQLAHATCNLRKGARLDRTSQGA